MAVARPLLPVWLPRQVAQEARELRALTEEQQRQVAQADRVPAATPISQGNRAPPVVVTQPPPFWDKETVEALRAAAAAAREAPTVRAAARRAARAAEV